MPPISCPGGQKPRYRVRRLSGGKAQRLAFCGDKAVEVTPMKKRGGKLKKTSEGKRLG